MPKSASPIPVFPKSVPQKSGRYLLSRAARHHSAICGRTGAAVSLLARDHLGPHAESACERLELARETCSRDQPNLNRCFTLQDMSRDHLHGTSRIGTRLGEDHSNPSPRTSPRLDGNTPRRSLSLPSEPAKWSSATDRRRSYTNWWHTSFHGHTHNLYGLIFDLFSRHRVADIVIEGH